MPSKATHSRSEQATPRTRPIGNRDQRRRLELRRPPEGFEHSDSDQLSVIVDHGKPADPAWDSITDISRDIVKLDSQFWRMPVWQRSVLRIIRAIVWGWKLWWKSVRTKHDGPIITYGHEHGFIFALLQLMMNPLKKRRIHLMFDLLLMPPREGIAGIFDRMKMRLFDKAVDAAVVWGKQDVLSFAKWYNLSHSKFLFHHYHTTLQNFEITIESGDYIFAGGNSARDYKTVIEAVREIHVPVMIATTIRGIAEMARPYPHITVKGVSEQEFRNLLAGCRIFIEAHDPAFPRTSGHQTMLNAMACGKPVVIADPISAEWYVRDGIDGLVVPIGDAKSLRHTILSVIEDDQLARRLSQHAVEKIRTGSFEIANTLSSIYRIAQGLNSKQRIQKNGQLPDTQGTRNRMSIEQMT